MQCYKRPLRIAGRVGEGSLVTNHYSPLSTLSSFKLRAVQAGVETVLRQQVGVCAALHNAPTVDHQDQVGGQNGAQAVSDDDAGAAGHHALDRAS